MPAAGFTLVELLVGLALFGLIATLGLAALQGNARLFALGESRVAALTRVQAAQALLRRHWEEAVPLADLGGAVAFRGEPARLVWIGRRPHPAQPGGLHVLSLEAAPNGRLLFGWRAHDPALPLAAQVPSERVVLLDGVEGVALGYFGAAGWRPDWIGAPALPRLIRLELRPAGGWRWPALVVAVGLPVAARPVLVPAA